MLRFWLVSATFSLALSGCTTAPPVQQVRAFAGASDAFNAASQPLLDEVAVSERERALKLIKIPPVGAKGVVEVPLPNGGTRRLQLDLPVDQVLAISTIGDPPATTVFRKGVVAIKQYASVLIILAENQNVDAARAELGILGAKLAGVAALVPGAPVASALVAPALAALQPLIDGAARAQNAAELRRLVLEAAPKVKALSRALHQGVEPLFHTIASRQREVIVDGGDADAAIARIDAYRVAFANWLKLLGLVEEAMDQLVAAVSGPSNAASLASLAELSTNITNYAEGARRALAVVRAGK